MRKCGNMGAGAFSEVWQGKTGMQHDLRHWKLATGLYIEPILLTDLGYNQCLHLELIMYLELCTLFRMSCLKLSFVKTILLTIDTFMRSQEIILIQELEP